MNNTTTINSNTSTNNEQRRPRDRYTEKDQMYSKDDNSVLLFAPESTDGEGIHLLLIGAM